MLVNQFKTMDCSVTLRCISSVVVIVLLFSASGCLSQDPTTKDSERDSCCSQKMCVFLFDRLEEQSIRLHNIEDALMRTMSILTSVKDQEFSTASAALKSDPLLNSLLISDAHDPDESIVLRSDQISNSLESPVNVHRVKRQNGERLLSPRERLAEALKWSKKTSTKIPMPSDQSDKLSDISQLQSQDKKIPDLKSKFPHSRETELRDESGPLANTSTYWRTTEALNIFNRNDSNTSLRRHAREEFLGEHANQTTIFKYVKDSVSDLQCAVKCAMGQLNDARPSESLGVLFEPQATLNANKTLTIQFELKNCQKYWEAVWIRVSLRNEQVNRESGNILKIPKDCMMKSENVFSLTLPSTDESSCVFPLIELVECKVYSVEIIPVYLTLQGQLSSVEITVPPELTGNSMDLVSLERISLRNSTHILGLQWSTQSGDCGQLMTTVDVRIYEDAADSFSHSFVIPTNCIKNGQSENSFTVTVRHPSSSEYSSNICTDIIWTPLDICRKYKLEIEPEYSSSWRGKASSLEMYTPGVDASNCCSILTSPTGVFQSMDYDGKNGCTWLISVEKNFTIWLTFTEFHISSSYYRLKVYDGPYSTSPLLLDQYGEQPPRPTRSQSNKLFIQLVPINVQYYYGYQNTGKSFTAHYISVCKDAVANT